MNGRFLKTNRRFLKTNRRFLKANGRFLKTSRRFLQRRFLKTQLGRDVSFPTHSPAVLTVGMRRGNEPESAGLYSYGLYSYGL